MTRTPNAELYRSLAALWTVAARRAIADTSPALALTRIHHAIRCEIESAISWRLGL